MSFYDYYDTPINKQYEKDVLHNGYIKIPFQNKKSIVQPNLFLPSNEKYKIKNIYIYKKNLGLDDTIDYDGELIIEHIPITNGDKNVYVCILLKTKSGVDEETDIDTLIHKSFSDQFNLNLNNQLKVLNTSCLVNNENTVYIFKKPLLISSRFTDFSDIDNSIIPSINKKNLKNQTLLPISSKELQEGFTENLDENEILMIETQVDKNLTDMFIDCQPVDTSDKNPTISMIPVNSDNLINQSTVIFMSTIQNFFIFIILIGILFAVVPNIYKFVIMKFIDDVYHTEPNKNTYLFAFDCIILFILFIVSMSVLGTGVSNNNKSQTSIGVLLFLCSTISLVLMIILKFMNKDYYNFIEDIDLLNQKNSSWLGKLSEILFDIFKRFFVYLFIVFSDGYNFALLCLLETFNMLFSHFYLNYDITNTSENGGYYVLSSIIVLFITMSIIYNFGNDL